ncbi:two-component system sensor histidine kinase NtrB [Symmachiella dynata]|uniref:two-component system sensor histidine kinase NtrB n=1 Tax=Symmachiella dynata TaxID=2527995 RepID=UPI0030EC8FD2
MFQVQSTENDSTYRLAIAGLLTLSVVSLAVTVWIMVDFLREQEIVQNLIQLLPAGAAETSAEELAGELRWQFRLTILVVLNLIVTGIAVVLLWRAYRSSQESLRNIMVLADDVLGSIDQAIITTDPTGHVTGINRCGIEMFALHEDQIGRPLRQLDERIPLEEFRQESRAAETLPLVRDFPVTKTGGTRSLRAFCHPLRNRVNEDIGNVVQISDVTERVLVEESLRRMERYIGLGSLAAGLHHEIKNPLAALSLHVQLMEEELEGHETLDEVHDMLGVIKTEMTRVGGVLESFRDYASLGQLNHSQVEIAKLIDRQVKLIAPRADMQNIAVRTEIPETTLPSIQADRVRLEQVLLNLLVNAMENMTEGGVLTIRPSVVETPTGSAIQIDVVDTGTGIPQNLRDRIFDPYFTTKSEGTGMGLALCDKIIRQHRGSLDFRCSDEGTTFTMTLPLG